ncbi:hypothetical protein BV898_10203 [Hypsibius exemplaris]|uniref:Uncharacterized protein n=1 Tax=Hypsibius exemplaris TaxID=2072580 RepID=A0A1W0WK92_HYPEX|nr:hypothetical protein BV898_10203 [Hypsibius exemplaris]
MKATVCLLMIVSAFAGANAETGKFSGSLVQQASLLLSKARMDIENAVQASEVFSRGSPSLDQSFYPDFLDGLQGIAMSQLAQIQAAIFAGQQVNQQVLQSLLQTLQTLSAAGSSFAAQLHATLQALLNNLSGHSRSGTVNAGEAKQLTDDFSMSAVTLQALREALGRRLPSEDVQVLMNYITALSEEDEVGMVESAVIIEARGLGDLAGILSQLWGLVGALGGNTYTAVHTLVSAFFETITPGSSAMQEAISQLLGYIRPFKWFLGGIYCQVVRAIQSVTGTQILGENCPAVAEARLVMPPWVIWA